MSLQNWQAFSPSKGRALRWPPAQTGLKLRSSSLDQHRHVPTSASRAETPAERIKLGQPVHGGFGTLIPVGIRIGLDAFERLDAKPREVIVMYSVSDVWLARLPQWNKDYSDPIRHYHAVMDADGLLDMAEPAP